MHSYPLRHRINLLVVISILFSFLSPASAGAAGRVTKGDGTGLPGVVVRDGLYDYAIFFPQVRNTINHATVVSAGTTDTCSVTQAGGVKCWGRNDYGQLGDGTTTVRLTPVDVTSLSSGMISVSAGVNHTCAITQTGGVKCWGANWEGQLGDGTTTGHLTPVNVTGLSSGVAAIAAGYGHTCALTLTGAVKCWGMNSIGQLGDGTTIGRLTPVDVTGLSSGVTAIAAGNSHICALLLAGGVKCWGWNGTGQLGDGSTTTRLAPVDVAGLSSGVAAISLGSAHTCAITQAGGVKCWGYNTNGQLGDGTTTGSLTPVDVAGLSTGAAAIAAGYGQTCALSLAGGVKCWGMNGIGQLGDGTTTTRLTPVDVAGLSSGVAAIAAGNAHTCALTLAGGVKCWGLNGDGQLGDGTTTPRLTPVDVIGLP